MGPTYSGFRENLSYEQSSRIISDKARTMQKKGLLFTYCLSEEISGLDTNYTNPHYS